MAEEQDKSQKTEEPTPRKLEEARKKGQVASSQEVKHWFAILGALILILAFAPMAAGGMARSMAGFLTTVHAIPLDRTSVLELMSSMVGTIALYLLAPLIVLLLMALAGSFVQHGPLLSAESLKPKLEKISPLKGLKRLFSMKALMEFVKGLLKIVIVGGIATAVILPEFAGLEGFAGLAMPIVLERLWSMAVTLLIAVLAVMTVIAGMDLLYQRFEFNKQQRMTKQEVKDEFKQSEGDPLVKAKLRQIRTERARRRMMAAVPEADVVITNPTHFAVAMAYEPETMAAPTVVAKGADLMALRIRELAREHDVTIVENPPLARALYQAVEIDESIPPEHYKAVAEVISYVFKLRRRPMPTSGTSVGSLP
jgi:flagellar biosynthetic protein FlhB